nr:hypothetical protein GCM10020063_078380 [Dactylosporangium thailandense]
MRSSALLTFAVFAGRVDASGPRWRSGRSSALLTFVGFDVRVGAGVWLVGPVSGYRFGVRSGIAGSLAGPGRAIAAVAGFALAVAWSSLRDRDRRRGFVAVAVAP